MISRAREKLSGWIENLRTTFTELPGKVAGWLTSLASSVGGKFGEIWGTVSTKLSTLWTNISNWVTGLPGRVASAISGIAGSIASSLGNVVKDAINSVLPNTLTLGGWEIPVPGHPKVPSFTVPIPQLAQGGIFDNPTLGFFGEAGREAVIPITRPTQAMAIMQQAGLDKMVLANQRGQLNAPLVSMPGAIIQDATDADLVAQRTLAALRMRGVPA